MLKQLSDKQVNIDIKDMDELCQTHLGRRFDFDKQIKDIIDLNHAMAKSADHTIEKWLRYRLYSV